MTQKSTVSKIVFLFLDQYIGLPMDKILLKKMKLKGILWAFFVISALQFL